MSLADLASIGSFVSGIAVLASLIFIGAQMLQTNRAMKAAASQAHAASFQQVLSVAIESGEVARLWRVGLADLSALTDDERTRFLVLASSLFRFYEAARLQWRHGQLDKEHWENILFQITDFGSQPGIRAYWTIRKRWHSTEFRHWFESLTLGQSEYEPYGPASR
jgi:hypothetical protein